VIIQMYTSATKMETTTPVAHTKAIVAGVAAIIFIGSCLSLYYDVMNFSERLQYGHNGAPCSGSLVQRGTDGRGGFGEHIVRSERKVPGTKLFMTGPSIPQVTSIIRDNLESGLEVHFFHNQAMVNSAKKIACELQQQANISGALDAFLLLRSWTFRADLWRYMILWSEGGVYVDHKVRLNMGPIGAWATLAPDEEIGTCRDTPPPWKTKDGLDAPVLFQAALSARRGSPLLADAIRQIISNVNARTYEPEGEPRVLGLTGPVLLGWAAANVTKYKIRLDCTHAEERGGIVRMIRDSPTAWTGKEVKGTWLLRWDFAIHADTKGMMATYGSLFDNHCIYCDEPLIAGENDTSCKVEAD
jgi:hypothetical protein